MNNKIVAFGEIMLRLSSSDGNLVTADKFDLCYGGTECNTLAALSNFNHDCKYLTALPNTSLGDACLNHIKSFNIDTSLIVNRGDLLGLYFVESANGSRGAGVIYYRSFSEFTRLHIGDFDYDEVFKDAKLFHISGISFALSESSKELAYDLIKEARKRNVLVSFDFNYRAKLWSIDKAREEFLKIVPLSDIILGSSKDLETIGVSKEEFFNKYMAKYLVIRDREVLDKSHHKVKVAIYKNEDGNITFYESEEITFEVKEKIGGGDAFNGSILHALLSNYSLKDAAEFALSGFIYKAQIFGDTFTKNEIEVKEFKKGLFKE